MPDAFIVDALRSPTGKRKGSLAQDPFSGTLFVFRNRAGTALKLLVYDGTGYCRIQWWPRASDTPLHSLEAQQLSVLLYNGLPDQAGVAPPGASSIPTPSLKLRVLQLSLPILPQARLAHKSTAETLPDGPALRLNAASATTGTPRH